MNPLRKLHSFFIHNEHTRKYQYRLLAGVRRAIDCPDAYCDIYDLIRKQKPDAFFDIGCFIGDTISRILDEVQVPIMGFEPTPASYEKCRQRFEHNDLVQVHNLALGNENGELTFHLNQNAQTNSLLGASEESHEIFGESFNSVATETAKVERLDDWAKSHGMTGRYVLKADVQGAEMLLIEGGAEFFKKQVLGIYSEAHLANVYQGQATFCDINQALRKLGFRIKNIYPAMLDRNGFAAQCDALWVNTALV